MPQPFLSRIARFKVLGKHPAGVFLRLNKWIWNSLPPILTTVPPIRSYGIFLHTLVRLLATRGQSVSTCFFRNRPQLDLIRRLSDQKGKAKTLRILVLGCSNGAEVYSILWTIRSARPDLKVIMHAVDISEKVLEFAQKGIYSLLPGVSLDTMLPAAPDLGDVPILERISEKEMVEIFDREDDKVTVRPWIKEGINWHLGDAGNPELVNILGPQDIVVANNLLCHMDPPAAEKCIRNIAKLVNPGGYLFVSGIDLDIRTKVALDLSWRPLQDLIEDIHNGDPSVRDEWPWQYSGLEPLNKRRRDWKVRYASVFQLG